MICFEVFWAALVISFSVRVCSLTAREVWSAWTRMLSDAEATWTIAVACSATALVTLPMFRRSSSADREICSPAVACSAIARAVAAAPRRIESVAWVIWPAVLACSAANVSGLSGARKGTGKS